MNSGVFYFFIYKSNERSEDSEIGLAVFCFVFQEKIQNFLLNLGVMHFLSSIEIHLLKVTLIVFPNTNWKWREKKRKIFLASKERFVV